LINLFTGYERFTISNDIYYAIHIKLPQRKFKIRCRKGLPHGDTPVQHPRTDSKEVLIKVPPISKDISTGLEVNIL